MIADVHDYFGQLRNQCNAAFDEIPEANDKLGTIHDLASRFFELSEVIIDADESHIIRLLPPQLESSALNLCFGLYRQAFFSLRLLLELGLGAIHFSVHKIEHKEWRVGSTQGDIKWAKLIDSADGILSTRFSIAFLPELEKEIQGANAEAAIVYRELSQYVHGNSDTWQATGFKIERISNLESTYFEHFKTVKNILITSFACRYLEYLLAKGIESAQIESLFEEVMHVDAIRIKLGRE